MSRIGKLPINIPAGVTVTLKDNVVSVKGPKGELSQAVDPSIIVTIENNEITFAIDEANDNVEQKQKQASTASTVRSLTTWLLVLARATRKKWSSSV